MSTTETHATFTLELAISDAPKVIAAAKAHLVSAGLDPAEVEDITIENAIRYLLDPGDGAPDGLEIEDSVCEAFAAHGHPVLVKDEAEEDARHQRLANADSEWDGNDTPPSLWMGGAA